MRNWKLSLQSGVESVTDTAAQTLVAARGGRLEGQIHLAFWTNTFSILDKIGPSGIAGRVHFSRSPHACGARLGQIVKSV